MAKTRRRKRKSSPSRCTKGKGKWTICSGRKKKLAASECRRVKGGRIICNTGSTKKPKIRFKKLSTVLK